MVLVLGRRDWRSLSAPSLMLCACAVFQVRLMITDAARHKLLVLTGQCFENTGELILQSGSFSFQNFIEIFTDQEVSSAQRVQMCVGRQKGLL